MSLSSLTGRPVSKPFLFHCHLRKVLTPANLDELYWLWIRGTGPKTLEIEIRARRPHVWPSRREHERLLKDFFLATSVRYSRSCVGKRTRRVYARVFMIGGAEAQPWITPGVK